MHFLYYYQFNFMCQFIIWPANNVDRYLKKKKNTMYTYTTYTCMYTVDTKIKQLPTHVYIITTSGTF